jgi:hypothetical protein
MFIAMFLVALGVIALVVGSCARLAPHAPRCPPGLLARLRRRSSTVAWRRARITPEEYKERAAILGGR